MRLHNALLIAASWLLILPYTAPAGEEPPVPNEPKRDESSTPPPGPVVRSRQPGERSKYLQPPGSADSYDSEPIDWTTIPPWRQTSFFGIRAQGQVFVFVIDCSGSMAADTRLIRAKTELRRTIMNLRFPQRYHIIFYDDQPRPMPGGIPQSADGKARAQTLSWLRSIQAEGGTDPRGAMRMALGFRPDAIYLLSDGEFPDGSAEEIALRNPKQVPIHCIDLAGGAVPEQLQQIAEESGGRYIARSSGY